MQSSIEEKRESICQTLKQLESREVLTQEDYDLLRTWAANSNSEIRTLDRGIPGAANRAIGGGTAAYAEP